MYNFVQYVWLEITSSYRHQISRLFCSITSLVHFVWIFDGMTSWKFTSPTDLACFVFCNNWEIWTHQNKGDILGNGVFVHLSVLHSSCCSFCIWMISLWQWVRVVLICMQTIPRFTKDQYVQECSLKIHFHWIYTVIKICLNHTNLE